MAETTWLQCVMPRPDWEALNKRREKLGVKWSQIIPPAVERYLKDIETGKIRLDIVKTIGNKPAAGGKPAPAADTKGTGKKAPAEKAKATEEPAKAPATRKVEKGAGKKTGSGKGTGKKNPKDSDPPMPPAEQTPEEDAAELAAIK